MGEDAEGPAEAVPLQPGRLAKMSSGKLKWEYSDPEPSEGDGIVVDAMVASRYCGATLG